MTDTNGKKSYIAQGIAGYVTILLLSYLALLALSSFDGNGAMAAFSGGLTWRTMPFDSIGDPPFAMYLLGSVSGIFAASLCLLALFNALPKALIVTKNAIAITAFIVLPFVQTGSVQRMSFGLVMTNVLLIQAVAGIGFMIALSVWVSVSDKRAERKEAREKKTAATTTRPKTPTSTVPGTATRVAEGGSRTASPPVQGEFRPLPAGFIPQLDRLIRHLAMTVDVWSFRRLLESEGYSTNADLQKTEGSVGYMKSGDASPTNALIVISHSGGVITGVMYRFYSNGVAGEPILLVKPDQGNVGIPRFSSAYVTAGTSPGFRLSAATEYLLFPDGMEENLSRRIRFDKRAIAHESVEYDQAFVLRRAKPTASHAAIVVHSGEYLTMALAKNGNPYADRVFRECFPELDPSSDWQAICGDEVVGNYAPPEYHIASYERFDRITADILEGRYAIGERLLTPDESTGDRA